MKQLATIICFILGFISTTAYAEINHNLTNQLKIYMQFNSKPNKDFYDQPILMDNSIQVDSALNKRTIIGTQSILMDNLPITVTMLLKIIKMNEDQVTLQFDLMSYGFNRSGVLIAQPQMILKNHQLGEIQAGPYKLRVLANWNGK